MMALILSLLPPALIVAGVGIYVRRENFERSTIALLFLALGIYYFHFYHTTWDQFSVDAEVHMKYVQFLYENHRIPTSQEIGAAARHPPAFYMAAAALLAFANAVNIADPEQFARHSAMACYVLFILLGTGIVRMLLFSYKPAYYTSLLLLLFWPVGVTMSGRINCDILLYAGQAGTLLALLKWNRKGTPESLCGPFLWAGIAVWAKNSGIIMAGLAAAALIKTVYAYRSNVRALMRVDLLGSIVFTFASIALTFWHGSIIVHIEIYKHDLNFFWHMLTSFNAFVFFYDTNMGLAQESFWNMWLHSLVLGTNSYVQWQHPDLQLSVEVLWIVILAYGIEGISKTHALLLTEEKQALWLFASFVILMTAAALYLLWRTSNPNYADARYAYPSVLLPILAFGLAVKYNHQAGRESACRIGVWTAVSFTCTSITLLAAQHWH